MGPSDLILRNEDAISNRDQMITPRSKYFKNKSELMFLKKEE